MERLNLNAPYPYAGIIRIRFKGSVLLRKLSWTSQAKKPPLRHSHWECVAILTRITDWQQIDFLSLMVKRECSHYCSGLTGFLPIKLASWIIRRSCMPISALSLLTVAARAGLSVMMPSAPLLIMADILIGSLTVQTSTFRFCLWTCLMNARLTNVALMAK